MSETKTPKQTNQVVDRPPNGLTGIPQRIHYPTTQEEDSLSEVDRLDVHNFLSTLAEIVIGVAMREAAEEQECEQ